MKLISKFETLITLNSPRGYIGCSQIGHSCDRYIWLNKYGKMSWEISFQKNRIFERGKLEEERILKAIDLLEDIHILDKQTSFSNKVLQGSCDGILKDKEGELYIFELKTMNDSAFKSLKKYGLGKSHAIYWAQCQAYMHLSQGILKTIFLVVNKNDESLYEELITYDPLEAEGLIAKAERINALQNEPRGIFNDTKKSQACFHCPFHQSCYGGPHGYSRP